MALTQEQMLDFLWKRVMFGLAGTDTQKDASNETITSPLALYGHEIWTDSGLITDPPPASTASPVQVYGPTSAVQCVPDPTVEDRRTWVAVADVAQPIASGNRLRDWVPPSFSYLYTVLAYAGDPANGGVLLPSHLDGVEWVFDYPSGVLHFPTGVPSALATADLWLVGYRYIGGKGVGSGASPGSTVYQLMLNYSGQSLDSVSGTPVGWEVQINDPLTAAFTVTHTVGRPPANINFFGQGPTVGTQYRMRNVTTYTELIYDTATPNKFKVTNATPFATGAQASTNAMLHIFF